MRIPIKATAREPNKQAGYISATSAFHAQSLLRNAAGPYICAINGSHRVRVSDLTNQSQQQVVLNSADEVRTIHDVEATGSPDGAAYSFRHARDPESLGQSFDIFRPAKWGPVLDTGNPLGRVQLQCEHARLSCFFNSSRHCMACHHDTLSGQEKGVLPDSSCRPR